MIWVFVVVAAVGVFVVAAVAVGRESFRLGHQLPATVFDLDEAVAHVAEELPSEAQARLSYDDVGTIIVLQLEHLRERGVLGRPGEDPALLSTATSTEDGDEDQDQDVVVVDQETVALAMLQVEGLGRSVSDDDVYAVISALHRHLADIGAIGPTA